MREQSVVALCSRAFVLIRRFNDHIVVLGPTPQPRLLLRLALLPLIRLVRIRAVHRALRQHALVDAQALPPLPVGTGLAPPSLLLLFLSSVHVVQLYVIN